MLKLQGDADCSANPDYVAGEVGDTYYVTVAGKIGGSSGKVVSVGDAIVCKTVNAGGDEATVGASWFVLEANIPGITTTGLNLATLANPSAVTFIRINADNSVTARSAADFLSDIGGLGTGGDGSGLSGVLKPGDIGTTVQAFSGYRFSILPANSDTDATTIIAPFGLTVSSGLTYHVRGWIPFEFTEGATNSIGMILTPGDPGPAASASDIVFQKNGVPTFGDVNTEIDLSQLDGNRQLVTFEGWITFSASGTFSLEFFGSSSDIVRINKSAIMEIFPFTP